MGRFETEVLKQEENVDVTNDRVRFLMDQRVPMRDGVHLSVDVILPAGDGPFPTITIRTPYESNSERWLDRGVWWASAATPTYRPIAAGGMSRRGSSTPITRTVRTATTRWSGSPPSRGATARSAPRAGPTAGCSSGSSRPWGARI